MGAYQDALDWLYGRQALGIKLGLGKVEKLLEAVGNPERAFRVVHVAGTNGKGSVATMLADAMQQAGHSVGRFTSPHLIRFTERIVVNGMEITQESVVRAVEALRPATDALDSEDEPPTFFELVTVMAFMAFRDAGVDWAVVEAGMGGRLDATNVVAPVLCIITNVGRDHQQFLGDHIVDIAAEKAGIMKPGVPCVTGARGEALIALKATSQALHCPMSILGEDYHLVPDVNGFRLASPLGEAHYDVALAGQHQLDNAALVVIACDALRAAGEAIPPAAVHHALAEATMPGRLETIHFEPPGTQATIPVLLDGAHNVDGAVALRRHFAAADMGGFHLITSFSADKDWVQMLDQWAPLAARVHGVALHNGRGLDPASMRPLVEGIGIPFEEASDFATALASAVAQGAEHIVVAGSLFLVGEARAVLRGESSEDVRGNQ